MLPKLLVEEIQNLSLSGNNFKPHKYIALLTAVSYLRMKSFLDNKIFYDAQFKTLFSEYFSVYSSEHDRDRPYTPFFHLRTTSFWNLIPRYDNCDALQSTNSIGGPSMLLDIVDHVELSQSMMEIIICEDSRNQLISLIEFCLKTKNMNNNTNTTSSTAVDYDVYSKPSLLVACRNTFVDYLTTLQRLGGGNENAIAEAQSTNSHFTFIHTPHPLAEVIVQEINSNQKRHIIITGHAGDGKSTIALEVFKSLKGIPHEKQLETQMQPQENLTVNGREITIIKDFSERDKNEDQQLVDELIDSPKKFLIISNTGTLLNFFINNSERFGFNNLDVESSVLAAISNQTGEEKLVLTDTEYRVFNLAMLDNLQLARKIFEKMLSPCCWQDCNNHECRANCPIYHNVALMQQNIERIADRLFLAYRRMFEYGTRLTMRQITEHLAYMITSGLGQKELDIFQHKGISPLTQTQYMFYNRFFGDNGCVVDDDVLQMQAVRDVRTQEFGVWPSAAWERRLWARQDISAFEWPIGGCKNQFEQLRNIASRSLPSTGSFITPSQARDQIRRMLYFLYDFSIGEQVYINHFLNSPKILLWLSWQEGKNKLDAGEGFEIEHSIYHVLQEHFTGLRLPENVQNSGDRRLYVTLSRKRSEVRQTAQIVLAYVAWSALKLKLVETKPAVGSSRVDMELEWPDCEEEGLKLDLPFLDYVTLRHFGEMNGNLKTSYINRLERFKARVQKFAALDDESVMLIKLRTDHSFRRQWYTIKHGKLEVSDAM